MSDLHARIAAAVAEKRSRVNPGRSDWGDCILAACDHADKVLARHAGDGNGFCDSCGDGNPPLLPVERCPEVRDLADLWLGPGWEEPAIDPAEHTLYIQDEAEEDL